MSDRARYYLERSVPELEDLQRKNLFTKKEATMIMRRWTDFEHRIMGRGSRPEDYLRYARFEKNLEKLRKMRYERLKPVVDTKPSISDWSAPRRIEFIFERGTRKFPNSMELWANYLKFARKNGSVKVAYDAYTRLLQLQPRNINAWLSAAEYEYNYNKNVKSARNLLKRCLRFNGDNMYPWLEAIKFEMNYLSKLLVRRKLMHLITEEQQLQDLKEHESSSKDGLADESDIVSVDEGNSMLDKLPDMNRNNLGSMEDNPVLRGDLIITLYDVCVASLTKNLENDVKFSTTWDIASRVLTLIDKFEGLDQEYLWGHIVADLVSNYPNEDKVIFLNLTLPLRGVKIDNNNFIQSLQDSVKLYQSWCVKSKVNPELKTNIRKKYVNLLTEKYLSHATGREKTLLELLLKKID